MSRTVLELDDELVCDVAKALGTGTKAETVNAALREVLECRHRAQARTRLRAVSEDGASGLGLLKRPSG
ncbi:type II toxin-antitoxin system VapB family antitoxin [Streptomyces toyocaensis]|uniref:type II toxin-antitoxin system VapB family antitoxin n=1 Tax=Streptomyces toyocaensis TaxID=55952 RepID=UPI000568A0FF|nr:type II toxin-antitoxin system VapB family antitoxin [Streptomyces toyocaensis]